MKYKLKKTYPGSPTLGTEVEKQFFSPCNLEHENFSEFWEEVTDKNYEVISYVSKGNILYPKGTILTINTVCNLIVVDSSHFNVNSVKRLKDSEIFILGDKVKYEGTNSINSCVIGSFYLNENGNCIVHGNKGWRDFSENIDFIEKVEKPLFITEDGVDIFERDTYYVPQIQGGTGELSGKYLKFIASKDAYIGQCVKFSTKEKTEEYIILNKPCLSLKEVSMFYKKLLDFSNNNSRGLKELVKDKLNIKEL